jgi:hypothetical protein
MAEQEQSLGVLKALALSEANRRAVFGTGSSKQDKGDSGASTTLAFVCHTLEHCLNQDPPPPAGFLTHRACTPPLPPPSCFPILLSLHSLLTAVPSSTLACVSSRAPPPLPRTIRHRRGILDEDALMFWQQHESAGGQGAALQSPASPFVFHADGEALGRAGMAEQALATLRLLCRDAAEAQLIGAPSPPPACTPLAGCGVPAAVPATGKLPQPLCHHPPPC